MDELIEQITMSIHISEDHDDKESAAFFTNILGRIRGHESELFTLRRQLTHAEGSLIHHGFVKCDISACNCGNWHPRYGLTQRFEEIKDTLAGAGHPLNNENGNLVSNALNNLVSERDQIKQQLADIQKDAARYQVIRRCSWWSVNNWFGISLHDYEIDLMADAHLDSLRQNEN